MKYNLHFEHEGLLEHVDYLPKHKITGNYISAEKYLMNQDTMLKLTSNKACNRTIALTIIGCRNQREELYYGLGS